MDHYNAGMTLEEQIGQVLMVGFEGFSPSAAIKDMIQRYHVGNIILFARNIHDTQQVLELTQSLQAIAKGAGHRYPLHIAIDQERRQLYFQAIWHWVLSVQRKLHTM
jgi:beta-N-acetylhexosaminidase